MDEGLTIMEMWSYVMRKKIVASIAFGLITILSFVFLVYIYNPSQLEYTAEFEYNWYGIEEQKYANGELFNYFDIISLENISEVQRSKEEYKNLSAKEIADGISIRYEKNTYFIVVQGKVFPNHLIAKDFIEDLIYLPYIKAENLEFNFKANLTGYERSRKVSSKLTYLNNQLNLILEGYWGMIRYFGDVHLEAESLSNQYRKAEVFAANDSLSEYEYLAYKNVYMTKEEYQTIVRESEALKTEQDLLRSRKAILLESLKSIYSNSNGNTYMDTSIANYLNSLHTIDERLMTIDKDLRFIEEASLGNYSPSESEAFLKELDAYKDSLEQLTEEYTQSVLTVLNQTSLLNIISIKGVGGISVYLAIPISILLGIISGITIGFLWGYIENYKRKSKTLL
ncbi:MAG: hypothetical protein K2N64_03280 [Anaeroplasmataceae bacterium]|nr:hypothetical protein [Anaeroplasmataceae bacterium]